MRSFRWIASGIAVFALGTRVLAEDAVELTDKQKREFAKPIVSTVCAGTAPGYPFSVERLEHVLQINDRHRSRDINVLVVDNGFLGYSLNRQESEGAAYLETANFPQEFFGVVGNGGFLPFLDKDDANYRPAAGDEMVGHGTHVSGIILGGNYQTGDPAPGKNLTEPNVRRLLLDDPSAAKPKSWMKIRVVPLGWGQLTKEQDPIGRLKTSLGYRGGSFTNIVNISLTRLLTSSDPQKIPAEPLALVVLAAGNATMHLKRGVLALPGQIETNERLLIVGSHDADGKISHFSNYGDRVTIAAPGCQIVSWTDGESKPQALSGTSMSTAVVSFAAALLNSQWETESGAELQHRLVVSARFEPQLSQCGRARALTRKPSDPLECIDHGAKLDIEAAALVTRDLIEHRQCSDDAGKACVIKIEVGTLSSVPPAFIECMEDSGGGPLDYRNLTYNAAIKRVDDGKFEIVTETGNDIGARPLKWDSCTISGIDPDEVVKFTVAGLQLTGEKAVPHEIRVTPGQLIRLVTRVIPER